MPGEFVSIPSEHDHHCDPGSTHGNPALLPTPPPGTVWQCICGQTWVCLGLRLSDPARWSGHVSPELKWKKESRRARRKRENR